MKTAEAAASRKIAEKCYYNYIFSKYRRVPRGRVS